VLILHTMPDAMRHTLPTASLKLTRTSHFRYHHPILHRACRRGGQGSCQSHTAGCVCLCVCVSVCLRVCLVYICVCEYLSVCVSVFVCACICLWVFVSTYVCVLCPLVRCGLHTVDGVCVCVCVRRVSVCVGLCVSVCFAHL
jgi:hypothetical protein